MAFSLLASKRSTRTGVVLDARIRPKPSENSTRRPSMVMTSSAPSNRAVAASFGDKLVAVFAFRQVDVQFGRGNALRQAIKDGRRIVAFSF